MDVKQEVSKVVSRPSENKSINKINMFVFFRFELEKYEYDKVGYSITHVFELISSFRSVPIFF